MKKRISMTVNKDVSIKSSFQKFIKTKTILGKSKDTIGFYEDCYRYFIEFVDETQSCDIITKNTIIDYIEYLQKTRENIKSTSINTYLTGLRTILNYFTEDGLMPKITVPLLSAEKKIKETYTDEELEKLL